MILYNLEELESTNIQTTNGYSKIIHLTWKNREIPERWKRSWDNWISLHPDFIVMLWTDIENRKLVELYYSDFLDKYDTYPYNIQRVDAVRCFYLHRYGGIYSDLDIAPLRSFETVLTSYNNEVLLLSDVGSWSGIRDWSKGSLLSAYINSKARSTNMLMISKPKSKFWDLVKSKLENPEIPWFAFTRHFYIMCTTGPFVIDSVRKKLTTEEETMKEVKKLTTEEETMKEAKRGKRLMIEEEMSNKQTVGILPSNLFQPCTVCDPKPCSTSDSYVEMLSGGSWGEVDSVIITWLSCYGNIILAIVIFILVLVLIWLMMRR